MKTSYLIKASSALLVILFLSIHSKASTMPSPMSLAIDFDRIHTSRYGLTFQQMAYRGSQRVGFFTCSPEFATFKLITSGLDQVIRFSTASDCQQAQTLVALVQGKGMIRMNIGSDLQIENVVMIAND